MFKWILRLKGAHHFRCYETHCFVVQNIPCRNQLPVAFCGPIVNQLVQRSPVTRTQWSYKRGKTQSASVPSSLKPNNRTPKRISVVFRKYAEISIDIFVDVSSECGRDEMSAYNFHTHRARTWIRTRRLTRVFTEIDINPRTRYGYTLTCHFHFCFKFILASSSLLHGMRRSTRCQEHSYTRLRDSKPM